MEWRNSFIYGSVVSSDYDVWLLNAKLDSGTKREYEKVSIAGRSGDLHIDKKKYSNVTLIYQCAIIAKGADRLSRFQAALLAEGGNMRISDTIHPEYFRKGTFKGEIQPRISRNRELAVFDLEFDCAPQRWLVSGEESFTIASGQEITLYNPTLYVAKPLIKIIGTGTLYVGSETLAITTHTGDMMIDCESEDAYEPSSFANLNRNVILQSGDFPVLGIGETGVRAGTVTSIEITPRWWTI